MIGSVCLRNLDPGESYITKPFPLHYETHLLYEADVSQRVAVDGNDIGVLALCHAGQVLVALQELCGIDRRRLRRGPYCMGWRLGELRIVYAEFEVGGLQSGQKLS